MLDVNAQKNIWRKKIFEERKNFNEDKSCLKANELICQNIIRLTKSLEINGGEGEIIGLYYPLKAEPNLLKLLFLINKPFALPVISNDALEYVRYAPGDKLITTEFKDMLQPAKQVSVLPSITIVPGLAFSISGYRLGFGRGHYDKYFKKTRYNKAPISIGVCFHDKLIEHLPFNGNDHKLDYIVTDKILIT